MFFSVFARLKVLGLENIPFGHGKIIFASNHTSELDPILIPVSIPVFLSPGPMFYTSLPKGLYNDLSWWKDFIYGGLFFKAWGAHPVRLGAKNYAFSLERHRQILEDKAKMCIFPEGSRSKDCKIKSAKGGIGYLAHKTGAVVIPTNVSGVCNTKAKNLFTGKSRFIVNFGKPMYINVSEDLSDEEYIVSYKNFAEQVMREVENLMKD